jgi:hypothetical protein
MAWQRAVVVPAGITLIGATNWNGFVDVSSQRLGKAGTT